MLRSHSFHAHPYVLDTSASPTMTIQIVDLYALIVISIGLFSLMLVLVCLSSLISIFMLEPIATLSGHI